MFMSQVEKKDLIKKIAIQDLRNLGVKCRPKKSKHVQEARVGRRVFKTALHLLPTKTVTLSSGQQLVIPKLLHDLCSFILNHVETEGLFRKGGSNKRQNEIKLSLDSGVSLGVSHHEIDVASVLKTFFRELPEPLFPTNYHEQFFHCSILPDNKAKALLLTCLLLPCEYLSTLSYFMQFLNAVSGFCDTNKMTSYNLAVVLGPTLFPTDEKLGVTTTHRLSKITELIQILIDNACNIGFIPEEIIDRMSISSGHSVISLCNDDVVSIKSKKKRRSGSLTRMFNGFRKMVGGKSTDDHATTSTPSTPDLLATPSLTKSSKKRKLESTGFSNKKKREVLQTLPDGMILNTPISIDPNFKNVSPVKSTHKTVTVKEKKSQWNLSSKRIIKRTKQAEGTSSFTANVYSLAGTKAILERRWSAVSHASVFKRNKNRNSIDTYASQKSLNENNDVVDSNSVSDPDYVKISRTEYEAIKNRVSAIEKRISLELEQFDDVEMHEKKEENSKLAEVQNAYEKTLVEAEPLSFSTDQLAKRLSRELKIRRSVEQKIIRSPSARKIGSLRQRSRERDRQSTKIHRTKTWHTANSQTLKSSNLRRGQPNTISSGLQLTPVKVKPSQEQNKHSIKQKSHSFHNETPPAFVRSCQRNFSYVQNSYKNDSSEQGSEKWTSAEGYFAHMKTPNSFEELANCRASLAKLRSQNAGMVLAKARLFDGLTESDCSIELQPSVVSKGSRKIGQSRNSSKSVNRSKSLRYEERRKSLKSPKGITYSNEKENEMIFENNFNILNSAEKSPLKDCNRIEVSGRTFSPCYITSKRMPSIKKSLTVRSPKRVCRTPLSHDRQTPLMVVSSSKQVY